MEGSPSPTTWHRPCQAKEGQGMGALGLGGPDVSQMPRLTCLSLMVTFLL